MYLKKSLYRILYCSFPLFFLLFIACSASPIVGATSKNTTNSQNWQQQVDELDQKITILSRWQQGYRMTAQQAQFKADRIQFQENNILDAKRLWKVAENASQKAQDLQVIINQLVEKRNAILKRHNQPIPKNAGYENKNSIEEQN